MSEDKIKKTIFLVEDDPLSMKLELDLLQFSGFDAAGFPDGKSALSALKDAVPDLIIIDIGLPDIDGYEIHRKIKEDGRLAGIKVIALSASVMKEDREKIQSAGFDAFIPKPIDTKGLVAKIREIL